MQHKKPAEHKAQMPGSFIRRLVRFVCLRLTPVVTLLLAVLVGYVLSHPLPMGRFFWLVHQPMLLGATRTPPVPADFTGKERHANEILMVLPGGTKMPAIGLGLCCRATAYHQESVRRSVLWYLLEGGRTLDTADLYLNHGAVGDGIRDAQARGVAREEIFLTTKIFPESYGYGATIAWFDRVLGELGLDYIDLVLMHAPRRWFNLYGSEETEFSSFECKTATRCRQETWKALSELRARGKIREVGVSNFRSYHIEPLLEAEGSAPVAVNQIFYHPWIPEYQKEVVEYCNKHGIALTGYFSLGGAFAAEQTQSMAQIKAIAAKHKKSSAQVLLRWSLQNNVSIIPGTGNPKHMRENLDVYGFDLSADEMAEIGRIGEANPMPNLAFPEFMNK